MKKSVPSGNNYERPKLLRDGKPGARATGWRIGVSRDGRGRPGVKYC